MTTYGYRYRPGGHVFELLGRDLGHALAVVHDRRNQQGRNQTPPTAELVEQTPDGWQPVPLPNQTKEKADVQTSTR